MIVSGWLGIGSVKQLSIVLMYMKLNTVLLSFLSRAATLT